MKLQGGGAERFARKPDPALKLALVFGEDEGVVADIAGALVKSWLTLGPANVITLDEDEIKREPSLLFDALEAQSLLGETAIIRVRARGEKLSDLLNEVLALAHAAPQRIAARLVVLNGGLASKSRLRAMFEVSPDAASLQVFADSDADMASLAKDFLAARGVAIEAAALSSFVAGLPGHRSLANAEMEKLALYGHGLGRPVDVADIRALCETNADESARVAVVLALEGKTQAAQAEMDRVIDAGLSAISLLRLFEMEAARMLAAYAIGSEGGPATGMKLRPPVWKTEWPAFAARLRLWPVARLVRLVERLHDLELQAKSPGGAGLANAAVRVLFTSLYTAAARGRR